ncbi:complex I subunit 1/NuoH family protein [Tengunoibacter tsumagoiensis]|uniref:NADH-quinone oxidoreductase subunit H n=1 Tax=Tengunoibacter tsumagoiensis TaxID=2014871 RepID=A0A402A6X9_9CHLR|nr:complex I subunit 1 family protein [Tengunoibacter tsumagoiensis]GCE14900.1 NADH-quinone oxidoreductase subunit H [Tengunoibacter tsumagoiensis]
MNTDVPIADLGSEILHGVISWDFLQFMIALIVTLLFVLTSAALLSFLDRKIMALMQDRIGPIHTGGPWGVLQAVADIGKLLLKEQVIVTASDKITYLLAPCIFIAPVIGSFAVLPLSPYISLPGTALATGLVFVVALSSIDVVGVFMAGWSSNNKYAMIGSIRGIAQMISYELPLLLSLVGIVMLTSILSSQAGVGTIAFRDIMTLQDTWQATHIPVLDCIFQGFTPWSWFVLIQPLMLIIYYTCGLAETNRSPFDLAEAESELVAGHLTEYSGVRWAMFFLGEYGNMTIVSAIVCFLFLGGWSGPGVGYLIGLHSLLWGGVGNLLALGYLLMKIYLLCFVFVWVRATLPRLRQDQLMRFAWLVLMPVTLGNIVVTGLVYLIVNAIGLPNVVFLIIVAAMNWIAVYGFVKLTWRSTHRNTHRAQRMAIRAQPLPFV